MAPPSRMPSAGVSKLTELPMQHQLVNSPEQLAALVADHAHCDAVMIDTEFMRRDTFFPQAALFQLCFPDSPDIAWLVDPTIMTDFSALVTLLQDESTEKVIHSASEDLEVFQTFLGCQPRPLVDTQKAAAYAGYGFGMGYRRLVEEVTGLELAKDETRSNWLKRPLTPSQLDYAAADVVPLLRVYGVLRERLESLGRLEWVLEDGAMATASASGAAPPTYLKMKSAWKLKPRQLAVLAAVCEWRENRARSVDKPRSWILSDPVCLALAQLSPRSQAELWKVPDMPAAVVHKQGDVLLERVAQALNLAEQDLPPALPRPLDARQRGMLKQLKSAVAERAAALEVEPEALLMSRDYELLVRRGCGEAVATPGHWSGWRGELLIQPLLELAGEEQ